MQISIGKKTFKQAKFLKEKDLEQVVTEKAEKIFGSKSIYLDLKKRIKQKKTDFICIPDGYVLDFRADPQLWVVENELSTHDSFRHIGIQLLKFSSQFNKGSYKLKEILYDYVKEAKTLHTQTKELSKKAGFTNISDALDYALYKNEYGFVIVIDEITDELINVTSELSRRPEIIEIQKFVHKKETAYLFDTLLGDISEAKSTKVKDIKEIDTIVCPAKEDGFKKVFLGEKAWHAIRISESIIPKLRYIAMYEVSPVKAIRYLGKIQSIKPYKDTGKYKVFVSDIQKIKPIKMGKPNLAPQAPRYTRFELLKDAKTLEDVF